MAVTVSERATKKSDREARVNSIKINMDVDFLLSATAPVIDEQLEVWRLRDKEVDMKARLKTKALKIEALLNAIR